MRAWSSAFVGTLVVEVPIVVLAFQRLSARSRILAALVASGISHPIMWLVLPRSEPYILAVCIAELCVVAFEAFVYNAFTGTAYSKWYTLMVSILANAASCLVGYLLTDLR